MHPPYTVSKILYFLYRCFCLRLHTFLSFFDMAKQDEFIFAYFIFSSDVPERFH